MCAVLVGASGDLSGTVEEVRMIQNIAPNKLGGFVMEPGEFLHAIEDTDLYTETPAKQYMGIIHSHYFDRPYPSIADWFGATNNHLYHGPYLIYSVFYEQLLGFYWNGSEFRKMELVS